MKSASEEHCPKTPLKHCSPLSAAHGKDSEQTPQFFFISLKDCTLEIFVGEKKKKLGANCVFLPHAYCQISLSALLLLH